MENQSEGPQPAEKKKKKLKLKGHAKRRGETAELAFMLRAASLGFGVAKPWGESERYDVILDSGKRLWRIQVRSTACKVRGRYRVTTTVTGQVILSAADIDVLVAYIVPLDIWYLVPVGAICSRTDLRFYPHGPSNGASRAVDLEIFREAWHIFR
ncbi:MAG: group I intron-associated PD-(D/E)XK endonuclease [Terriglobales bacterium]